MGSALARRPYWADLKVATMSSGPSRSALQHLLQGLDRATLAVRAMSEHDTLLEVRVDDDAP